MASSTKKVTLLALIVSCESDSHRSPEKGPCSPTTTQLRACLVAEVCRSSTIKPPMPPARHVRARVVLKSLQVPSDLQFCPSCSLWRLPLSSLSSLGASAARSGSLEAPPSSLFLRTASLQARASRNDTTIRRKASKPSALRSLGATLRPNVRPGLYGSPQSRSFSNVSPVTSINAAPDIPTRYKALHEALNVLKNDAANYVNLSALQLALHGLESENPVVRIGGT